MKTCSACNEEKPISDFQVRKASNDGLTSSCKSCLKIRDAARYIKEKDYRLARHKLYMKTDNGRIAHKKASQAWKGRNAVRRAANLILGHAVRAGKVIRLPCFVCGAKAHAHHPDYDRPLDVIWLCPKHHKEAHKLTKEA